VVHTADILKLAANIFSCILGEIPVHSVSLEILGVQVVLFSIDPFLWTASLQAANKRTKNLINSVL
jgi:hypothetical protein